LFSAIHPAVRGLANLSDATRRSLDNDPISGDLEPSSSVAKDRSRRPLPFRRSASLVPRPIILPSLVFIPLRSPGPPSSSQVRRVPLSINRSSDDEQPSFPSTLSSLFIYPPIPTSSLRSHNDRSQKRQGKRRPGSHPVRPDVSVDTKARLDRCCLSSFPLCLSGYRPLGCDSGIDPRKVGVSLLCVPYFIFIMGYSTLQHSSFGLLALSRLRLLLPFLVPVLPFIFSSSIRLSSPVPSFPSLPPRTTDFCLFTVVAALARTVGSDWTRAIVSFGESEASGGFQPSSGEREEDSSSSACGVVCIGLDLMSCVSRLCAAALLVRV
jgi:hypothetical protein